MAEVEAVLSSENTDDKAPTSGLTRATLLGRALAAAENMCNLMKKEEKSTQEVSCCLYF